jgi:organic radical activating enzyme
MSVKVRKFPEYNYLALHDEKSGITARFGKPREPQKELPPEESEFYDIAINNKCHGGCSWCYAKATGKGQNFEGISETWTSWISKLPENSKPFSVAIGSIGEPTEHPDLPEFLKTVYESGVSPSYTTNGVIIGTPGDPRAGNILDATEKYCKGVAVSLGNRKLSHYQKKAISALSEIGVKISLHYIISDQESIDFFVGTWKSDREHKYTHVLLPLVDINHKVNPEWRSLRSEILKYDMKNIAFGAKFMDYLKGEKNISLYPEGLFSKNMIIRDRKIIITKSSFDLRPLKIIKTK